MGDRASLNQTTVDLHCCGTSGVAAAASCSKTTRASAASADASSASSMESTKSRGVRPRASTATTSHLSKPLSSLISTSSSVILHLTAQHRNVRRGQRRLVMPAGGGAQHAMHAAQLLPRRRRPLHCIKRARPARFVQCDDGANATVLRCDADRHEMPCLSRWIQRPPAP